MNARRLCQRINNDFIFQRPGPGLPATTGGFTTWPSAGPGSPEVEQTDFNLSTEWVTQLQPIGESKASIIVPKFSRRLLESRGILADR